MMNERHTEHAIDIPVGPRRVYGLIADAIRWPLVLSPTVHVEQLNLDGGVETLRIWAIGGDRVRSWLSRRYLDPEQLTITFVQDEPVKPVAMMRGQWQITKTNEGSHVLFRHQFAAENGDKATLDRIEEVVNTNSVAELDSLRTAVMNSHPIAEFEDRLQINADPDAIFRFLADAQEWGKRLPHVARINVQEDPSRCSQVIEMDTKAPDGSVHTTRSVRALERQRILYKQTTFPSFLKAHVGSWEVMLDGTTVARHRVAIDEGSIPALLGDTATIDDARAAIATAIGGNSRATLRAAKSALEGS